MQVKKTISFILPVYNEQNNLPTVYTNLAELIEKISSFYDYEIIFVNDGSTDDSWSIIQTLSEKVPHIKGVRFSRNFGYQSALTAGYDLASGDAIITMDSDMQHPPYLVEKMIAQWQQGSAIVYAQRINRDDTFLKKITAHCYYKILHMIANVEIPRNVSDFRLIDKKVVQEIKKMREKSRYLRGMIAWTGFDYSFVHFEQPARLSGSTKYTWSKLFKIAFDGIISFSSFPFKLALYSGLFILMNVLLIISYQCISFFKGKQCLFFNWLIIIIAFIVGMQLLLIWVLGESIGSIYEDSKNRPPYIISEKINCL